MKDLLDLAVMREMAAGCGWRLDELVERYLREAHSELEELKKTSSVPEAKRVAHGLKGRTARARGSGAAGSRRYGFDRRLTSVTALPSSL
ncbi:MAG: hypothetical protein ACYTDU_06190 [Planctomycetota bacterium]|jgi:hypothetical protein